MTPVKRGIAITLLAGVMLLALARPSSGQVFQMSQDLQIRVDERGSAQLKLVGQYPPSEFADLIKIAFKANLDLAKGDVIKQVRGSLARLGLEVRDAKCEVAGLGGGETLRVTVTGGITTIARRSDNRWTISLAFVNPEEAAKELLDEFKAIQTVLRLDIFENAGLSLLEKTSIILPKGAEPLNADKLENLGQMIDFGGGTYEEITVRIETVDGRPAIISETHSMFTTEDITITPQEFLQAYRAMTIEYVQTSPTEGLNFLLIGAVGAAAVAITATLLLLRKRW